MGQPANPCRLCSQYERKHHTGPRSYGWCKLHMVPTHACSTGCEDYDGAAITVVGFTLRCLCGLWTTVRGTANAELNPTSLGWARNEDESWTCPTCVQNGQYDQKGEGD